MTEKTLLIVAHAPSDNTRRLVESILTGARQASGDTVEVIYKAPSRRPPRMFWLPMRSCWAQQKTWPT